MESLAFNRILVPSDFSDVSRTALKMARKVAPQCELRLIHVLPPIDSLSGNVIAAATQNKASREETLEKLHNLAGTGKNVTFGVQFGNPAGEIIQVAEDWNADLIVMPARSHGAIQHALLGSVTEHVLRSANCPVLVLPVQS